MSKFIFKQFLGFILLLALQVFILNKICLWGMITPMVYIVFIFSLPFNTPKWLVVLLGFLCGLSVDIFFGMLGYHALATLVIAFLRAGIIRLIPLRVEREEHLLPIFYDMKFGWYFQYAFCLILIHQFVYYFADALSFHNFGKLMLVVSANTLCSLLCIFLIQILVHRPSKRY
ncbi:MAG: rod shape-determining protein MreD [Lentimicrobiaceae bacterium]|nr:rod shape-determining protein MreD [Lentimicrobiaceae bacterium]